jgi:hypothetical protein
MEKKVRMKDTVPQGSQFSGYSETFSSLFSLASWTSAQLFYSTQHTSAQLFYSTQHRSIVLLEERGIYLPRNVDNNL